MIERLDPIEKRVLNRLYRLMRGGDYLPGVLDGVYVKGGMVASFLD